MCQTGSGEEQMSPPQAFNKTGTLLFLFRKDQIIMIDIDFQFSKTSR